MRRRGLLRGAAAAAIVAPFARLIPPATTPAPLFAEWSYGYAIARDTSIAKITKITWVLPVSQEFLDDLLPQQDVTLIRVGDDG